MLLDGEAAVERREVRGGRRGELGANRLDAQAPEQRMVPVAAHEGPPESVEQHDREPFVLVGERLDLRGELSEGPHARPDRSNRTRARLAIGQRYTAVRSFGARARRACVSRPGA